MKNKAPNEEISMKSILKWVDDNCTPIFVGGILTYLFLAALAVIAWLMI